MATGVDPSKFSDLQQDVLLGSAFETLQQASRSPVVGGSYASSSVGAKYPRDDGSPLAELAKVPEWGEWRNRIPKKSADEDFGLSEIQASGSIVFGDGTAVGGWTSIALYPNGAFNFNGHLHDSGGASYDMAVTWVVTTNDGQPSFSLPVTGRVHGTFEAGSRDFDWNASGTNPALAAAWPELAAGYRWQWNAAANVDIGALIGTVVQAIGSVGTVIRLL
ncbi:hypothetical protein ACFVW1_47800 [Streptomyces olivochromogenes]|uniref:hypothetical protein n=1 Tax=Streptomyces olivochromogenes TaxID=1963 RepID=UPI0036DB776F